MNRRQFNGGERVELYLRSGGLCCLCGRRLVEGWHADHVLPWSRGGETNLVNGQALCPSCNRHKGVKVDKLDLPEWQLPLRSWQHKAYIDYVTQNLLHFLICAVTGSGKTNAMLRIAHHLLKNEDGLRLVVVCPTEILKEQWADAAAAVGIQLDPHWRNSDGHETADFHGVVITYQSLVSNPKLHRKNCLLDPTIVLFDEIHHLRDVLAYGAAALEAFEKARRVISSTGTPFRSDGGTMPFVNYVDGVCQGHVHYPYFQALMEDANRQIFFPEYEGQQAWFSKGKRREHSFADDLPEDQMNLRLRTALMSDGDWLPDIIAQAWERLQHCRAEGHTDAGMLITFIDQDHAERCLPLVRRVTGVNPPLIVSDDPEASRRLTAFKGSTDPIAIGVKMFTEGFDCPRLRVGVYATNVVTEMFFLQFAGRFLRVIPSLTERKIDQSAYLYFPADPRLVAYAKGFYEERVRFLAALRQRTDGGDGGGTRGPSDWTPLEAGGLRRKSIICQDGHLSDDLLHQADRYLESIGVRPEALHELDRVRIWKAQGGPPANGTVLGVVPSPPLAPHPKKYKQRDTAKSRRTKMARQFAKVVTNHFPDVQDRIHDGIFGKLAQETGVYSDQACIEDFAHQEQLIETWHNNFVTAAQEGRGRQWLIEQNLIWPS